jgi:hypothetical protein
MSRDPNVIPIKFASGATLSTEVHNLSNGCHGTILVPSGSDAIGKTLQFVATKNPQSRSADFADTDLLSTAKTLAAGANALTVEELTEVGAAQYVKFKLGTAAGADISLVLLWKD